MLLVALGMLMTAKAVDGAALAARNPMSAGITSMFIDACINGELKLEPDQGKRIDRKELSSFDQDDAHGSKSAIYYKIVKPQKALLMIAKYDPPPQGGTTELCMMNIDGGLNFKTQVSIIQQSIFGYTSQYVENKYRYQVFLPDKKVLVTLYPWQMFVQTLDEVAMRRLPKKGFAGFGISLRVDP